MMMLTIHADMKFVLLVLLSIALQCTPFSITCDYFDASECGSTNYGLKNYQSCNFDVCGGDFVSLQLLSCVNNPFLRLHSENGSLLMMNDDETTNCPYLEFSLPNELECATYNARIGCFGNETDCAGQLFINFTYAITANSTAMSDSAGDNWVYTCPTFAFDASSDHYGDPDKAAECSFEACPGQYYEIEMANCGMASYFDLYSYSDLHSLGGGDCSRSVLFMGMDTCQVVSVFQYCYGASCRGTTSITAHAIPQSNLTWADGASATSPGEPLNYTLQGLGHSVDSFFDDAFVALFRTDMLSRIMPCNYFSYYEKDSYSYLYYDLVTAADIAQGTVNRNSENMFLRSPFGGSYQMVMLYFYEFLETGLSGVHVAGASEVLLLGGGEVTFSIILLESDAPISASWSSPHPASDNDYIALYEIDSKGKCSFGAWSEHDRYRLDSLWFMKVPTGSTYGNISTTAVGEAKEFQYNSKAGGCVASDLEFRYMYQSSGMKYPEAVGYSDVIPAVTQAPTPSPTGTPTSEPSSAPTFVPSTTPSLAPTTLPTYVPTVTPTYVPSVTPSRAPTGAPTQFPTLTSTGAPSVSRSPTLSFYTEVFFSSVVRLQGVGAGDMDIGASNAFVRVTADSMVGVSTSDIDVTATKDAPSSSGTALDVRDVADKAVDISFTTRLILETSSYSDPVQLVGARQNELTTAYADPATSTLFVESSVEFGSSTVLASTEVAFDTPVYSSDVIISYTTKAPTSAPTREKKKKSGGGGNPGENNVIIFIIVIIGVVVMSGVAGYLLSNRSSSEKASSDTGHSVSNKDYYKTVGSMGDIDSVGELELVVNEDYQEEIF